MSNSHTARKPRRASPWLKAAILYAATWATTTVAGVFWLPDVESIFSCAALWGGLAYSVPLMTILTAHELGHFFQARRHGVVASPPYFIPLPLPPFGTMGAVINMTGRVPNLRALFDVGVTGPLAGLAATLVFLFIGLSRSSLVEAAPIDAETMVFG
ncbi:MAG: site-2 protease family protein, partial [Thermoguttaceae bacterium]|nr:site-2 protease family protein [Thermoguttaceae bacterium]